MKRIPKARYTEEFKVAAVQFQPANSRLLRIRCTTQVCSVVRPQHSNS
jgi:hypothetical protein